MKRDVLIEYLLNKDNWSEYAVSGLTIAVGAATGQEFINSYNMVNVDDIEISDSVENARALGYMSKFKSGGEFLYQLPGLIDFNSLYILPKKGDTIDYRLASKSANYISAMLSVSSTSHLSCPGFESKKSGVRPIVSLESGAKLVQNNSSIKVVEK